MNQMIINSIENRLLLAFDYKGKRRIVEPHTYGVQHNGHLSLCAWQVAGGSGEDFRLYLDSEITSVACDGGSFDGERPNYLRGDQRYAQIFAEL